MHDHKLLQESNLIARQLRRAPITLYIYLLPPTLVNLMWSTGVILICKDALVSWCFVFGCRVKSSQRPTWSNTGEIRRTTGFGSEIDEATKLASISITYILNKYKILRILNTRVLSWSSLLFLLLMAVCLWILPRMEQETFRWFFI